MNLFCEEVHKLEAEFKQCRKLLNAIGDENRQHLICVMMSGGYTMGSVYKLPDTWTPTFDLSNHEKVSARNDYAEKPLKKVVEEIVERKNGDRMQRNMPYFVRLVVDYFYDRMRKTKNLQYGDRTQNHGQYKKPYTKI